MKLWILSDLHVERGVEDIAADPPDFDVFVCAGDVVTSDIYWSIEMVAALARGKPAVFVAGNHEWMGAAPDLVTRKGRAAAERHGVHWLECEAVEIGGVKFAGATLWEPGDARFAPSVVGLAKLRADVVVTHFPPSLPTRTPPAGAKLWIFGHQHGFLDARSDRWRLVRNALGYPLEVHPTPEMPRPDYVTDFEP